MLLNQTPDAAVNPPLTIVAPPGLSLLAKAAIAWAFLAPFLLYFGTAHAMVDIWNSSETFAHGYIILPISLWLIWRRRGNLAVLPLQPYWPALGLVVLASLAWLLARMGEVQVVMEYAFVSMIALVAMAILGLRMSWSLAFPLLFLLLAVPFGEIFIDPLIAFTADFTVWALQTTGIPVLRNGTRFEIPSGSWSVVEACSGVRYLISSVTLGLLYAYLTYRSTRRRLLFMVAAVLVPIVANGMRAYMIVMIGHLSGMKLAVGVDHIIYGWLFFGLVMFILFWIGNFWREDEQLLPVGAARPAAYSARAGAASMLLPHTATLVAMTAAITLAAALGPVYALYIDRVTFNPAPVHLGRLDISWPAAPPFSTWTPRFTSADASFTGAFQPGASSANPATPAPVTNGPNPAGTPSSAAATATPATPATAATAATPTPVGLSLLYYRNQGKGKAVITSSNHLTGEKDDAHQLRSTGRQQVVGNRTLAVREAVLQTSAGKLLVWQWYWVGAQLTANDYVGKLLQAKDKLLLRGDDGAAILVSAPFAVDPQPARDAMQAFLAANLPAIDRALTAARGG